MSKITNEIITDCLRNIKGPDLEGDIISLGMVSPIVVNDGKVIFSINVPAARTQELEPLRAAAQNAVEKLDGVLSALVILTAERTGGASENQSNHSPRPQMDAATSPAKPKGGEGRRANGVPGIKSIIAIASGKGGVGKSTSAVNIALGLSKLGQRVGVLDADIYGPSMPRMLGITDKPTAEGKIMNPLEGFGLKVMSMGFLVDEETPMIWRGPMVMSALTQMLREVAWGELDILVVDMPPGTGDAQLTMSQQVPLAGAVIVSTPQDIALIDARKGLNMFKKVDVPILGIVENMSMYICPKCGERADIFGHGGAREEAERMGVPFLGEIPLHLSIRTNSDSGNPIVVAEPDGVHAGIYVDIAQSIIERLSDGEEAQPNIVFE